MSDLLDHRRIDITAGCWEWTLGKDEWGYGTVRFRRKMRKVHRVAAHLFLGFDLESDTRVLHHCDNPTCFNPEHLFFGTDADNAHDRDSKGRQWNMKKTHCSKGHPFKGVNLYRYKTSRYCKECNRTRSREWSRKMSTTSEEFREKHRRQARESYQRRKDLAA